MRWEAERSGAGWCTPVGEPGWRLVPEARVRSVVVVRDAETVGEVSPDVGSRAGHVPVGPEMSAPTPEPSNRPSYATATGGVKGLRLTRDRVESVVGADDLARRQSVSVNPTSENAELSSYAARPYSWCNPPSTGTAITSSTGVVSRGRGSGAFPSSA